MLFDAHTHLNQDTFSEEHRAEIAEVIEASGIIEAVVDVGFDLGSSLMATKNAAQYSWCYAAVGVHPHDADSCDENTITLIRGLAAKDKVKAIGEIGLDYHYDNSQRDAQRLWFRKQIQLANELKMPIVIHSRDADQETMDILKEEGAFSDERCKMFPERPGENGEPVRDARVYIHCFSGSAELAKQYVKLGATIGICGPVTYKNNKKTVKVVEEIPLEYLMVETDAPYLTPVPFRGKENMSPYVEYTARKVAEIKGIDYEDVAKVTTENAKRFYSC